MRLRVFLSFAIGFAAGVITLAAVLWAGGAFHPALVASAAPVPAPSAPAAVEMLRTTPPPAVHSPAPAPVELDRGTTLAMPLEGIDPDKLDSTFAATHNGHPHEALDIMAPRGTPVHAVDEGNVVKLFTSKEGGLTVYQFNNARTLCYYYAHLDRYATGLKEGVLLRRGDVLGRVGSTGNASPDAPHLHFAVFELGPEKQWWKGTAIDPLPLLQGRRGQ